MTESLEAVLAAWLPGQRWYPAKGRTVAMRVVADLTLAGPEGGPVTADPRVSLAVVDLGLGDDVGACLQVPLVARRVPLPDQAGRPDSFVGVLSTPDGPVHLYDGPHDPAYVAAVGALLRSPARLTSRSGWVASFPATATATSQPNASAAEATARVLTGEQSNTSIIVTPATGPSSIIKVFRTLQSGENPDITLQTALAAADSDRVPPPLGHLRGGWIGVDGREVVADLLFASEYLVDAPDAWRTATRAVELGTGFDDDARDLGAATAEVHLALAAVLPSSAATPALLARLADSLTARVAWAISSAPILAAMEAAALAVVDDVRSVLEAPAWQRIHGDLHLGQVLRPPGRGWVLLDFEGEPLRPLRDRIALDTPLRDVAGMLRSFDYAARRVTVGLAPGPATDAAIARADEWAAAARDAYCRGYASASGRDPRTFAALLAALELEKALYEVVYETRNRPSWLPIPLHAVHRLLDRPAVPDSIPA